MIMWGLLTMISGHRESQEHWFPTQWNWEWGICLESSLKIQCGSEGAAMAHWPGALGSDSGWIFPPLWTPVSSQMRFMGSASINPVIPYISTSIGLISKVRVFIGPYEEFQTQLGWHWEAEGQVIFSFYT